ncbi:MAG: hypothetical protein LBG84_09995 [Treponema sp.]|jgi:hypothetical protein|nr:hypothetical protein [Treponema sp.]
MKKKYPLMKAARFFAAAIFAVLVLAACEQPAGTLDGGRDIGAVELRKIGLDPAYPLDGAYTLRENVTLSGWTPIGTFTAPFTGTLDGRGRTITLSGARGGLFAFTRGAVIRNLSVRAAISAEGRAHNAAAGSVVNTMLPGTRIVSCEGSGSVALTSNPAEGLMVYAGGLVGYAGDGSSDGSAPSGCVIENSGWSGTVTVTGGYPYAGGVIGYNYSQSVVRRCSSAGTVTSRGSTLPYAGGVAGYNSRESLIEDCYSTAEVQAVSESKAALAGGVAGADAAGSTIRRCYAAGGVSAAVDGGGSGSLGGSLGVRIAANAGGIVTRQLK